MQANAKIISGGNFARKKKERKSMENNRDIPFIVYEGTEARHERTVKRLIVALIIVTALMFISNMAWLYVWQQYDYESMDTQTAYTFTQDSRGLNNINMGNQGAITNGADSKDSDTAKN